MTDTREAVAAALALTVWGSTDVRDDWSREADAAIAAFLANPPVWLTVMLHYMQYLDTHMESSAGAYLAAVPQSVRLAAGIEGEA